MPVSPKGKLQWAKLFTPEKKFATKQKPNGVYAVDLILPKEVAAPMQKLLKEMDDAHFKKTANEALKKFREGKDGEKDNFKDGLAFAKAKEMKRNPVPGKPVKDENLEETGEIKFSFKEDAVWEKKDGTWRKEMKPSVRNAKNKPWDKTKEIGNGSLGKVAYEIKSYDTPAIGVSIKLRGVQVLDWVEYTGSGGDSSPFEEEEGEDINAEEAVEEAEELFKEEEDVPF
jgi:hypothetical protein